MLFSYGIITCTAADHAKLDAFLSRCKRLGYCDKSVAAISDIFSNADDSLFESINTNSCHIFYQYLPDRRYSESVYNLRPRNHNRSLITKTTCLNQQDFLIRMLYKNSYWQNIHNALAVSLTFVFLIYYFLPFSTVKIVFYYCISCVCQLFIKETIDWLICVCVLFTCFDSCSVQARVASLSFVNFGPVTS